MNDPYTKDGVLYTLGMPLWRRCIPDTGEGPSYEYDPCQVKGRKQVGVLYRPTKMGQDRHFIAFEGRHYTTPIQELYSSKEAALSAQVKEKECELDALRARVRGVKVLTPRAALADLLISGEQVYELICDTCYDEPESDYVEQFRVALLSASEALK